MMNDALEESLTSRSRVRPFALKDAPALIEAVFPAQKVSFEAQRERKAGAGQTLTALGSYWKGRKQLILVRAIVLGSLLPQTDDAEKDLEIFEKLMAFDEGGLARREPKISPAEIARRIELANPWSYFTASFRGDTEDAEEIEGAQFPLDVGDYPGLTIRWRRDIDPETKLDLLSRALATYTTYEERAGICKRPEEMDQDALYAPIWPAVNAHLGASRHRGSLSSRAGGAARNLALRPPAPGRRHLLRRRLHPFRGRPARVRCLRLGSQPHRLHADLGSAERHRCCTAEARRDRAGAAGGGRGGGSRNH